MKSQKRKVYKTKMPGRRYPSDIGLRWCIRCIQETHFKWSPSQNSYVCELCEYTKAMSVKKALLDSEGEFIKAIRDLPK